MEGQRSRIKGQLVVRAFIAYDGSSKGRNLVDGGVKQFTACSSCSRHSDKVSLALLLNLPRGPRGHGQIVRAIVVIPSRFKSNDALVGWNCCGRSCNSSCSMARGRFSLDLLAQMRMSLDEEFVGVSALERTVVNLSKVVNVESATRRRRTKCGGEIR
jgi:hypothetical protein